MFIFLSLITDKIENISHGKEVFESQDRGKFHYNISLNIVKLLLFQLLELIIAKTVHINYSLSQVFDAFVITVSWALDIAFWEGLWAHPENEAANIMIFILPWRVIRIVNSEPL